MEKGTIDRPRFRLCLFVADTELNSLRAIAEMKRFCETHLRDRYELRIVDVFEDYEAAIRERIVGVPALLVEEPPPRKVIVGSLQDHERLLKILGIEG